MTLFVATVSKKSAILNQQESKTRKKFLLNNMKATSYNPTTTRLKEAICDGRMYQTRHLIESGVDVNFVDDQSLTPLMHAAQLPDGKCRTRSNLLKLLLQHGAKVNIVDKKGRHVLSRACIDDKEDIVRLLVNAAKQDVDLNLRDFDGNTPLMHSVRTGNATLVKFIVSELNKFQVDIDVRNLEDRTPYLEAKRLGNEDCAAILLTEGNASTNIQVNPFLDFESLKEEATWNGRVRGVEESKYATISNSAERKQSIPRNIQKKAVPAKKTPTLSSEKSASNHERILRKKTSSPRKISSASLVTEDTKYKEKSQFARRRKYAWHERIMKHPISRKEEVEKELELVTAKLEGATEHVNPDSISELSCAFDIKQSFDHDERQVVANSKAQTPGVMNTLSNAVSCGADTIPRSPNVKTKLHVNTAVGRKSKETPITRKPDRSYLYSKTSENAAMEDEYSWYSHFSVYNSPSVSFLNKIMAIYAEQMSPDSSFRFGAGPEKTAKKPEEPMVPKISVVAMEANEDSRSEGGRYSPLRSAVSSRCNSASSTTSNRRFQSAVSRTVASYLSGKRSLSTLKVQDVDF